MKTTGMIMLLATGLGACAGMDPRPPRHEVGEAQIVALVVHSEPPGARVRVNKIEKSWTTPCDIADFSLTKGMMDVEVSLPGYQTVTTKARYDGYDPAILNVRLAPMASGPVVEAAPPAPPPPPPAAPAAREPAPVPAPAAPAPAKLESTAAGSRLRIVSGGWRVRIQANSVVADPEKPGEYFLPSVPPDRVIVEFLDPRTDVVVQSVELSPPPVAGTGKLPEPKEAPAPESGRVGEVKVASRTYGVFVKLDPGLAVQPGEDILIFRDGREVARSRILKITPADSTYPDGAAQLQKDGAIQKGDEVRRPRP
jgi:hypothetical protein